MSVTFENTVNRTEVTRWYSVTDAPVIVSHTGTNILPIAAHFVFVDGELKELEVNGRIMKKDGTPGERIIRVPTIWSWNHTEWPEWLWDLYRTLIVDNKVGV